MFQSLLRSRLLVVALLLTLGLGALPVSPAAAANCSDPGPGAYLAGCDFSGQDLSGMDLAGANLSGANLEGTILDGADLRGANLSGATVYEDTLDNADTRGANLRVIVVEAPVLPSVSLGWSEISPVHNICYAEVSVTGLKPGSYDVFMNPPGEDSYNYVDILVGPDGTGSVISEGDQYAVFGKGVAWEATVNGLTSALSTVDC